MIQPEFPARKSIALRPTLFDYAKSAGYTTAFLSNVADISQDYFINKSIDHLARDLDFQPNKKTETIDDHLLFEYFENKLQSKKKRFYIFETYSAHWPYAERYAFDKKYALFQPDFHRGETQFFDVKNIEKIINSYDNAIVHFDDSIRPIFSDISKRDAVYIITSDHGQSFNEQNTWAHCSGKLGQLLVPLIIIASNQSVADRINLTLIQSKANFPISHSNIFMTILSIMGFDRDSLEFNYSPSLFLLNKSDNKLRKALISPIDPPDGVDRFVAISPSKAFINIE